MISWKFNLPVHPTGPICPGGPIGPVNPAIVQSIPVNIQNRSLYSSFVSFQTMLTIECIGARKTEVILMTGVIQPW